MDPSLYLFLFITWLYNRLHKYNCDYHFPLLNEFRYFWQSMCFIFLPFPFVINLFHHFWQPMCFFFYFIAWFSFGWCNAAWLSINGSGAVRVLGNASCVFTIVDGQFLLEAKRWRFPFLGLFLSCYMLFWKIVVTTLCHLLSRPFFVPCIFKSLNPFLFSLSIIVLFRTIYCLPLNWYYAWSILWFFFSTLICLASTCCYYLHWSMRLG